MSSVLVTAAGCGGDSRDVGAGPTLPTASARAAAEAFITLSGGGRDQVPWADRVTYSITGKKVTTFAPGVTVTADLDRCPPDAFLNDAGEKEFEGRTCPISPLSMVLSAARTPSIEKATPEVFGCNRFIAPKVPAYLTSVSIRPPEEERSCAFDFVVTLYLNDAGKVEWLDFALSGP
ncbi:MAG: hypothetical protein ACT4QG_08710 [Sporichthyaceae bacterium]